MELLKIIEAFIGKDTYSGEFMKNNLKIILRKDIAKILRNEIKKIQV